jgi:serine/threonine protein kinase
VIHVCGAVHPQPNSEYAGVVFAVKCIAKIAELKQEEIVSLKEEVQVLRTVDHPNIIKLYEFYEESDKFYMVTELMEGGELFDRIVKKTFYTEKEARDLVKILLSVLQCVVDQTSRGPRPRHP